MRYVNLHLVETTEMWKDLVISESGARLVLQEPFLLQVNSPKVSRRTANSWQKSVLYNCLFCFQVSVFHQRPLINLHQINFIYCCSLLFQQWITVPASRGGQVVRLHTTSGPTASIGFRLLLSHHAFFHPFLCRERPFSPHVIRMSSKFTYIQN